MIEHDKCLQCFSRVYCDECSCICICLCHVFSYEWLCLCWIPMNDLSRSYLWIFPAFVSIFSLYISMHFFLSPWRLEAWSKGYNGSNLVFPPLRTDLRKEKCRNQKIVVENGRNVVFLDLKICLWKEESGKVHKSSKEKVNFPISEVRGHKEEVGSEENPRVEG